MKNFRRGFFAACVFSLLQRTLLAGAPFGDVIGWGYNMAGEATGVPTGNPPGTPNNATGVVTIVGLLLSNVAAVSTGQGHSLALRSDGTVVGWGNNSCGEAIGFRTEYPFRTNGQVKLSGLALSNVTAVSAGSFISLVLKRDGTVLGWGEGPGENKWGELKVPSVVDNVVAIAAGTHHSLALKKDGKVVEWNVAGEQEPLPTGLSNVVAIAAGRFIYGHNLALKDDGTVVDWTTGGIARPVPDEASNVVSIASGDAHNLALRRDGTVVGWGSNQFGEVTGVPTKGYVDISQGIVAIAGQRLTNVVAIAAGHEFSLALKRDGTVVAWGSNESRLRDVPAGLTNVVAIAAGYDFCLAITTNGAVAERFRH
jgi:alpha-tubulin suppressor-like RCC1 family protein